MTKATTSSKKQQTSNYLMSSAMRKEISNSSQLALIMNAAQRSSPYKEQSMHSLGSLLFNRLNGSTGGDFTENEPSEEVKQKLKVLKIRNKRMKEFTPVMQQERNKRSREVRYHSVFYFTDITLL